MKAKAILLTVLAMSTVVMLAAGPAWAEPGAKVSYPFFARGFMIPHHSRLVAYRTGPIAHHANAAFCGKEIT